jgi:hypothetical protein
MYSVLKACLSSAEPISRVNVRRKLKEYVCIGVGLRVSYRHPCRWLQY